jgi:hypothetical protein
MIVQRQLLVPYGPAVALIHRVMATDVLSNGAQFPARAEEGCGMQVAFVSEYALRVAEALVQSAVLFSQTVRESSCLARIRPVLTWRAAMAT